MTIPDSADMTAWGEDGGSAHHLLILLRRIIRATDIHSKRLHKETGLTTAQMVVLQAVGDMGEVTTSQISRRASLSQSTVTLILDHLERKGLVERYRSATDRRVVHARPTAYGKKMIRTATALLHETFISQFHRKSDKDQTRIIQSLRDVADMLDAGSMNVSQILDPPRLGKAPVV